MATNSDQIYSATYSNVPVFEFVTEEGPIMRRKSDGWINATHILKIAKFPKAKRTRILEKDVQTGIHEKVQGGYGKYQGTYVPLDLGVEIAKTFGAYEVLKPIFDFEYVEGKSETPPPAPKHNHASASNVARRLQQQKSKQNSFSEQSLKGKRPSDLMDGKAQGKIKRVALTGRGKPEMNKSITMPLESGPSMGIFNPSQQHSFNHSMQKLPPLMRQDTERDALSIMASNMSMNMKRDDLEVDDDSDMDDDDENKPIRHNEEAFVQRESDEDDFMSGRELFGPRDYGTSRESFEKVVQMHNKNSRPGRPTNIPRLLSINGSLTGDSFGQIPHLPSLQFGSNSLRGDPESIEYFNTLLNFFLDDSHPTGQNTKAHTFELPDKILNPPQPLSKINIDQPIDNNGNTIFHWACSMGNVAMIEFLLSIFSKFINSEIKNFDGETPLMFMVQFNNSYQLDNFPAILDLLFDSVLSVDNIGRTILHHIALAVRASRDHQSQRAYSDAEMIRNKEKFSKYYLDVVFSKIIEFPDFQLQQSGQSNQLEDKKEVISKFVNHQDTEGNTAFHIIAHFMSKKCIKTFIKFHKFIDFGLKNSVNYSVEDYLASHNYVLRLEGEDDKLLPITDSATVSVNGSEYPSRHEHEFLKSKRLFSTIASASNQVTEKLSGLNYSIEKEVREKDEKLRTLHKCLKTAGAMKLRSQQRVLRLFDLDFLLAEEKDASETSEDNDLVYDASKDKLVQEEISRLNNDIQFQVITVQEKLDSTAAKFRLAKQKVLHSELVALSEKIIANNQKANESNATDSTKFADALRLQQAILKGMNLISKLCAEEGKVPVLAPTDQEEFKENVAIQPKPEEVEIDGVHRDASATSQPLCIANLPASNKLHKYCKLIALSCGMSFTEVENSIELIEQSLTKSV